MYALKQIKLSEQIPDTQLMKQVAAGDAAAFHQLAQRYGQVIYRAAVKYVGDAAMAEDITQQVMMTWWQKAASWDVNKGKLITWLLTITHRRAMDHYRKVYRIGTVAELTEEELHTYTSEQPTQLEHVEQRQLARLVAHWVEALPEKQKQVVWLTYFAGWPNSMTATHLNTSVKAVESLLVRARKTLRQQAEGVGQGRA